MILTPIATMRSPFTEKFGLPRQSGLVAALPGTVVFEPAFRNADALRGLAEFSHIWLIWGFSRTPLKPWSPTVRPPRLGGDARLGVFATRSPFRPNSLGLSCVALTAIRQTADGPVLDVAGADLMDGTPIYDIKPYLPYADCLPDAACGFASAPPPALRVDIPAALLEKLPAPLREPLMQVLAYDPRPAYQHDAARRYGMAFGGFQVRFTVADGVLTVQDVTEDNAADFDA
jgi:tRNA-Thr(GGU) m(6)t(6)A37 methyltransferase TsaA